MKDNPTQTAREQAIAKLEFSEKDKWWLRMSRDTFKALEKEIKEMPLEEIDTLPPPLKTYIIGFRPELKSTLDELENEALVSVPFKTPFTYNATSLFLYLTAHLYLVPATAAPAFILN